MTARLQESREVIAVTGLKHSGKSAIAQGLSRALGLPTLDLDEETLHLMRNTLDAPASGNTLREFFRAYGAEAFRKHEAIALEIVLSEHPAAVIACGGGVIDNRRATNLLAEAAFIVYLSVEFDVLFDRISRGGIPPFLDPADPRGSFVELAARRDAAYRELAHLVVPISNRSVGEAVEQVATEIKENRHAR